MNTKIYCDHLIWRALIKFIIDNFVIEIIERVVNGENLTQQFMTNQCSAIH